jgi:hypothetical protein
LLSSRSLSRRNPFARRVLEVEGFFIWIERPRTPALGSWTRGVHILAPSVIVVLVAGGRIMCTRTGKTARAASARNVPSEQKMNLLRP